MAVIFLTDEWFAQQDEIKASVAGLQMNEKLAALVANLLIDTGSGDHVKACYRGGFLEKGHTEEATATITLPAEIAYKGLVLGETAQAVGAMMSGKVKVEGNKGALLSLASAKATETQKEFTTRLKGVTEV